MNEDSPEVTHTTTRACNSQPGSSRDHLPGQQQQQRLPALQEDAPPPPPPTTQRQGSKKKKLSVRNAGDFQSERRPSGTSTASTASRAGGDTASSSSSKGEAAVPG